MRTKNFAKQAHTKSLSLEFIDVACRSKMAYGRAGGIAPNGTQIYHKENSTDRAVGTSN